MQKYQAPRFHLKLPVRHGPTVWVGGWDRAETPGLGVTSPQRKPVSRCFHLGLRDPGMQCKPTRRFRSPGLPNNPFMARLPFLLRFTLDK